MQLNNEQTPRGEVSALTHTDFPEARAYEIEPLWSKRHDALHLLNGN